MDFAALSSTIGSAYGVKLAESGYLLRFFHHKITLPEPNRITYANFLFQAFSLKSALDRWGNASEETTIIFCTCLGLLCDTYNLSLRQQNRVMTSINITLRTLPIGNWKILYATDEQHTIARLVIPLVLSFFKEYDELKYKAIKNGHTEISKNLLETWPDTQKEDPSINSLILLKIVLDAICRSRGEDPRGVRKYFNSIPEVNSFEGTWSFRVRELWANTCERIFNEMPPGYLDQTFDYIELIWPAE